MAKLYFYYSAMNAGKTTVLLQSNYNYKERGMRTLLLTPIIDDRYQKGMIHSRIGLEAQATMFGRQDNLMTILSKEHNQSPVHCVLLDEAQFLTQQQVMQLSEIVDQLNIPVLAYGLRTDFQGQPFEGSSYLLAWADNLTEIKTVCHCGRKATFVLRLNEQGKVIEQGEQIAIGGNELYLSVCRRHFHSKTTQTTRIASAPASEVAHV